MVRVMAHRLLYRIHNSVGPRSGLDQKFANCAGAISKLRIAFCKLHRLINRAQRLCHITIHSVTCHLGYLDAVPSTSRFKNS